MSHDARIAEARPIARAIRDDIATIRFDEARTLDDLIGPDWLETLALRAAQAAIEALRRPDDGRSDREGGGWRPIATYPREAVQFGPTPADTTEWGPEALLLMPPCAEFPHEPVAVTGHLEADEWLSRDSGDPAAWGNLAADPIGWLPLPISPPVPQQQTEGTGDAWPSRCIKPNACARHRQCMYAQSTEACPYFGRDLTADIAAAEATRPDPARPGGRDA